MTDARTPDVEGEHRHLGATLKLLNAARERLADSIDRSASAIDEQKKLMWANRRDMDHAEKANVRTLVETSVTVGDYAVQSRERIDRLLNSPYFGRVDFLSDDAAAAGEHYIGVHSFWDPETQDLLVHDWRAPVSSLYYDYESGEAYFESPDGIVPVYITDKRQYKIEHGQLQYMLQSSLNIGDEVLQRELSQSADDKMKNIVATIQREQNAIIRNDTADVLILQGVAGSGKTSIALHRVAFLLYRFKDTLSSENVMILSPNKVFGDYIANVLPELGEEQIAEIDFDEIAKRFLSKVTGFETFSEQVVGLLDNTDAAAAARMRYKATPEFVVELDEWLQHAVGAFTPAEIAHGRERLDVDWVGEAFASGSTLPIFARLDRVADSAVHLLKQQVLARNGTWAAADGTRIRKQVRAMYPYKDAEAIYRSFFQDPSRRGLFRPIGRKKIEYSDVFPLIYTIIKTTKHESFDRIQHLLVDEMQDYTPVQYAVLRRLFSCKMTILGDSNQSVNPYSSSSLSTIHSIFPEADCLELCKSYRSTAEITDFAQHISRNDKLIPIERHGLPPRILNCDDASDETSQIVAIIHDHAKSDNQSLGIVCKTVAQATQLYQALSQAGVNLALLDYDSSAFVNGIIITSAHIAKGLEFDVVIVPDVDDVNYATDMDRSMLYIACTRAMHELHLTHSGQPSPFLRFATEGARGSSVAA